MSAKTWFRVSSVLLLLLAAGHTFGFLQFHGATPESIAVRASMDAVRFPGNPGGAATLSFGNFYVGFGLFATAMYLFAAWMAWRLGAMAGRGNGSSDVAALGWAMVALMASSTALAVRYFFVVPIMSSAVSTVCLVVATWQARRRGAGSST